LKRCVEKDLVGHRLDAAQRVVRGMRRSGETIENIEVCLSSVPRMRRTHLD
jgi:hypothetical protein